MDTSKVDWVEMLREMLKGYEPDAVDLAMDAAEKQGKFVVANIDELYIH